MIGGVPSQQSRQTARAFFSPSTKGDSESADRLLPQIRYVENQNRRCRRLDGSLHAKEGALQLLSTPLDFDENTKRHHFTRRHSMTAMERQLATGKTGAYDRSRPVIPPDASRVAPSVDREGRSG
jgi:hypothetical protein